MSVGSGLHFCNSPPGCFLKNEKLEIAELQAWPHLVTLAPSCDLTTMVDYY